MNTSQPQPNPLSPAVFYILLALAVEDRHGYGIMKQAESDSNGQIHLGPGTLYGTIKRLLEAGYVEEADERTDPTMDDTRRKYYRITKLGRQQLTMELERMDRSLDVARRHHLLPGNKLSLSA